MAKRAVTAVATVASGVEGVRSELDAIRAKVVALKGDLELELGRPVPPGVVQGRIEQTVAVLRERAEQALLEGGLLVADGGHAGHELAQRQVPAFAVAALFAPDAMKTWMKQRAEAALARLPEPVDAQERGRRARDLTAELLAAERAEARLVWEAADLGLALGWRPDHDPVAVLGLDEERA